MTLNLDPFQNAFGMPPSSHVSDEMMVNSMPVMEITPGKPNFDRGLNLFSIEPDTDAYLKILKAHGYTTNVPIRVAFLADNFPTDTFTNDYGETFLQKFTDVASQGMSQLAQMTGSETGTEGIGKIGKFTADIGEDFGDSIAGKILKSGGGGLQNMAQKLQKFANNMESKKGITGVLGGGANLVNKMLAGHRVDFPQVWRNSGFSPSYTATVRLYNPNPGSKLSTEKYIVGPLAALLTLALPRSESGNTYNWPFFHKIRATGIYNLDPAVITNMTVIKGGDQQQIAYNQKLGIVDVRLDFSSLYNSILVEEGGQTMTNRPTMRSYLNALKEEDRSFTKRGALRQIIASRVGVPEKQSFTRRNDTQEATLIAKNQAAKQRNAPRVQIAEAGTRVSPVVAATQFELEEEGPIIT
jgi:hypothetical protein